MTVPRPVAEHFRHFETREGLVETGHLPMLDALRAVTQSPPTMHHVGHVIEAVASRLGARRFVDPCGGDVITLLYKRDPADPDWLVAQPFRDGDAVPGRGRAVTGGAEHGLRRSRPHTHSSLSTPPLAPPRIRPAP